MKIIKLCLNLKSVFKLNLLFIIFNYSLSFGQTQFKRSIEFTSITASVGAPIYVFQQDHYEVFTLSQNVLNYETRNFYINPACDSLIANKKIIGPFSFIMGAVNVLEEQPDHSLTIPLIDMSTLNNLRDVVLKLDSARNLVYLKKQYSSVTRNGLWPMDIKNDVFGNSYIIKQVATDNYLHDYSEIQKINPQGNVIWCKQLMLDRFYFDGLTIANDTSVYIITNASSGAYLTLIDSSGVIQWLKKYPAPLAGLFESVTNLNNGTLLLAGLYLNTMNQATDVSEILTLINIDYAGNVLWKRNLVSDTLPNTTIQHYTGGRCIVRPTPDNNLTIMMPILSHDYLFRNFAITKFTTSGNVLWSHANSGDVFTFNVTPDSGFYLAGQDSFISSYNYDALLIKTDSLGFAGCQDYTPHFTITNDTVIPIDTLFSVQNVIVTDSNFTVITLPDTLLYIYSMTNCFMSLQEFNKSSSRLQLYPNPTAGQVTFKSDKVTNGDYYIVTDLMGKIVLKHFCENEIEQVDLSGLAKGVYVIMLYQRRGMQTGKVVVE